MPAAIASPAPSTVLQRRQHPPYKEMILRAIASLRDRHGSSRPAISKFISATFSDLPPTHNALLSTHLRRLRSNGVLSMVKHSYKLASPADPPLPTPDPATSLPKKRGRPPKTHSFAAVLKPGRRPGRMTLLAEAAALMERKRPGRPRKPTPGAALVDVDVAVPAGKRKRGRPVRAPRAAPGMLVFPRGLKLGIGSLHADANVLVGKRKPSGVMRKVWMEDGRLKVTVGNEKPGRGAKRVVKPGVDLMPPGEKRKAGRPKRVVQFGFRQAAGGVGAVDGKRKPGRPKRVVQPGLILMPGAVSALDGIRKPGRQKKVLQPGVSSSPGAVSASDGNRKPVRPKRVVQPGLGSTPGAVSASDGKRKPGRPKRVVQPGLILMPGAESASFGKRKLGRPKRVVRPGLILMPGTMSASVGKRKPGRPKRFMEPGIDSTPGIVSKLDGKRKPGRPKSIEQPGLGSTPGAMSTPDGKRKPGRPKRIEQPGLESTPGAMSTPDGKRKPGRPKRVVQPNLISISGVASTLDGKRKPGRPKRLVQPGLNLTPGAVSASDGKRKAGRPKRFVQSDLNLMPGAVGASDGKRKPSRPRKIAIPNSPSAQAVNGSVMNPLQQSPGNVASTEKRKQKRPRKSIGQADYGLGLIPQSVITSAQKKKPGRPRKLPASPSSAVTLGVSATLSDPVDPSPRLAAGEVVLSPDPVPAAVSALVEMKNPVIQTKEPISSSLVGDDNTKMLNPLQQSSGEAAEKVPLGVGPMDAALTVQTDKRKAGRPRKLVSSTFPPTEAVNGSVTLLDPLQQSSGNVESTETWKLGHPRKAAGEAESGLYLMPQAVNTSIEKMKPGQPSKLSASLSSSSVAVGDNATLLSPGQPSPGKVEGNAHFPSI